MTMLLTLLSLRFRAAGRYFKKQRTARLATALLFLLVLFAVAASIYALLVRGLNELAASPFLTFAVSLYLFELAFFVIALLIAMSALITGLLRLFSGTYDLWIIASPRFGVLPWVSFARICAASLWPVVLIGLPALLAVERVFDLSAFNCTLALAALILLGMESVGIALVALFALALARLPRAALTLCVIALCALAFFLMWREASHVKDVVYLFPTVTAESGELGTASILAKYEWYPSHPVAQIFFGGQTDRTDTALASFLLLLTYTAGILAAYFVLARSHLTLWQRMQENPLKSASLVGRVLSPTLYFGSTRKLMVLFQKEGLLLLRNERNILWLGFVFFLWLLQIGFDVVIRHNAMLYGSGLSTVTATAQALLMLVIVYYISMFVLRFVFPSFSVERDTAWIVGSMPLSLPQMFIAKFLFFASLLGLLSMVVVVMHSTILQLTLLPALLLFALVVCAVPLLVLFGLTLGVVFPNFETADPELLSTSLPGLSFIAGSLLFGAAGAYVFRAYLLTGELGAFGLFILVTAILFLVLWRVSKRALSSFEFAI